jgi:4-hydroxy-3-polyprenylbenzoate decarboxylase
VKGNDALTKGGKCFMFFDDLRDYIKALDKRGLLTKVEGADWNLEIGTITELVAEKEKSALLFDKVKGYPKGYRVFSDGLLTPEMQRLAFGDPEGLSDFEIVKLWKDRLAKYTPCPPVQVKSAPILENVLTGKDIDLFKFPTPKWHERDGGLYIGTADAIIIRDPDDGWVNAGTYRVMIHDKKTLSSYMAPPKHCNVMRQKHWAKGEDCPVVMSFGHEPLMFFAASSHLPFKLEELSLMGYIKGKPIEVVKGEFTGLPIPATAEIVIEGFLPPPSVESKSEGPFGEWTGYYASGVHTVPIVNVKAIYHRNNPIIFGQPPLKPPYCTNWPIPIHTAAPLWSNLEKAGMSGIKGVWVHGANRFPFPVISIKQEHHGHAHEVGHMAAALNYRTKFAIVVDDDIDPSNWEDVMWAVFSRCDPAVSIDLVTGLRGSPLDPWVPPKRRARGDFAANALVINACRPFYWKDEFPEVNRAGDELRKKVMKKWSHIID